MLFQDVGLSPDFTIRETLEFYGRVYDINALDLNVRINELATVLELLDMNLKIKQLSGGEQRRVSLSVTMLHGPKLLLLDEPTVGVDPVLSLKIWEYLVRTARSGVTVIITTHYVEEARMAHLVGMMRDGELLVEESPAQLMTKQRVNTLEHAFLQLSKQQQLDILQRVLLRRKRKSKQLEEIFEPGGKFKKHRLIAQLIKNYIIMKRNLTMFCLMLLLPFTLSFLQREAYAGLPKLKIALVSEELDLEGESLCHQSREYFSTDDFNCTTAAPFTCLLLQSFRGSIDTIIYDDEEGAKAAVLTNKVWGMLHVPSNFTNTLTQLVLYGVSFLGSAETDQLLGLVTIDAHLDSSNFIINQWLRKKLTDRYQFFVKTLAVSCGLPDNYATVPVRIMDPIHGQSDPTLTESILPAFLSSWCFYLTLLFTTGAVMMEKSVGLVERNMVAGMTYLETVVAHTVFQTVLITVQKGIMLAIFYAFYDETLLGSKTLAVVLLFAIEAVGVAYGNIVNNRGKRCKLSRDYCLAMYPRLLFICERNGLVHLVATLRV
ncbi:hypothetical protein GE061_020042 [Apolygus lucorum]|uniref:ABC transporter domain-containing protein n=1 Tax=Apolygus lucorum TaxID=248454 RepID=A0A8S9XC68_APOLU|nr:hypothetical protein GE061_020042 [Apolygus lucorum]